MDARFSDTTRRVVAGAEEEARRLGHNTIGTEHLLLGLLSEGTSPAAQALSGAGATLDGCRSKVVELTGAALGAKAPASLKLSDRARRTLERADRLSLRLPADAVEPEHVLVCLLDVEGRAGQALWGLGVDLMSLRESLAAGSNGETVSPAPIPTRAVADLHCASCGSPLEGGLSHRTVESQDQAGGKRDFLVAYCASCGAAVGSMPAGRR